MHISARLILTSARATPRGLAQLRRLAKSLGVSLNGSAATLAKRCAQEIQRGPR
jgi:hypothetical protein